jgi:hypothetical protein
MPAYLLTVESAQRVGELVRVLPAVPIRLLIDQQPGMLMPMPGDPLELRLPDGRTRSVPLGVFGVETWTGDDGALYTTSDPADPVLTLRIDGDVQPDEVPAGTEVWLSEPGYGTNTP